LPHCLAWTTASKRRRSTFAEIGSRTNFSAGQIALFLLDPHPKMPNMSLTRREADDLAAYLKKMAQAR
jgi:hypothetical protein